ncbi:MAG: peptidylprolyl isomerase [Alphaproteobacteria bacterium]
MIDPRLMTQAQKPVHRNTERGNTAIIALVVLVLVAVGAIAYLSGQINIGNDKEKSPAQTASAQPAGGQEQTASAQPQAARQPQIEVKDGNPVVGSIEGKDITRADVLGYIQTLPPQTRQSVPALQLFDLSLNQMLNEKLIAEKAAKANLDNDPFVKEQLAAAKEQIVRQAFIQKQIEKGMTDERLKEAYNLYVSNFPKIDEVKTRHILVKEEAEAKDVLKKLKDGGDFVALAKEHSIDGTKDKGGDLGYVSAQDKDKIIPEFLAAALALKPGEVSKEPVKTEFGYHIIEVTEERIRPPASFEQAKPFLAAQLSNAVLNDVITKWREEADVKVFDINGDPIEPAAGDESPEAPAAEEAAQ